MRSLLAFVDRRNAENGVSTNFAASAAATAQAATDNIVKALFNNDGRLAPKRVFAHSGIYANDFSHPPYSHAEIEFFLGEYIDKLNIKFITGRNTNPLLNTPAILSVKDKSGEVWKTILEERYNEYPEKAVSVDIDDVKAGTSIKFIVGGDNTHGAFYTYMKNISVTRPKRLIP
jgi:hypothetical protein